MILIHSDTIIISISTSWFPCQSKSKLIEINIPHEDSSFMKEFSEPPTVHRIVNASYVSSLRIVSAQVLLWEYIHRSVDSMIDISVTCKGCRNQFHSCMETKWRNIYLQCMTNYFEQVGYEWTTATGVKKRCHDIFLAKIRSETIEYFNSLCKCEKETILPDFMKEG